MTKREIKLQIKFLKDSLRLAAIYEDDFIEKLGRRGLEEYIDIRLEKLKYYNDLIKKIENN